MKRIALLPALALLGACNTILLPPNVAPVVPPTRTMAEAEARLRDTRAERAAVEARFAASEAVCYAKFFVNNCLDDAKEKRRVALAQLKAVEIEAEYFQRKTLVEARDKAVDEAEKTFAAEEARRAAAEAVPAPVPAAPPVRPPRPNLAARRAEQAAKQAKLVKDAPLEAAERARNVADYEARKAAALKRQARVEEKKKEKAARNARQEAKKP